MTASSWAGIIAAGDGLRLQKSHPGLPKPLVPVLGIPLAERVALSLFKTGAGSIVLIHNSRGRAIRTHLKTSLPQIAWTFIEADTESSWHSYRLVCQALAEKAGEFLVSTTDALIAPADVARFGAEMKRLKPFSGLALTEFIDDEKPLWADLQNGKITRLGENSVDRRHVTAGLYFMSQDAALQMPEADSCSRLRQYWTALAASGAEIAGLSLGKTLDVDRPEDIAEAERCLATPSW
jgi:NDP-sugar pyrophosphorylase family protein